MFYGFLQRRIRELTRSTPISLDEVKLVEYSISEGETVSATYDGDVVLRPMTGTGIGENRDPNMVLLQEAIDKLNEYWGGDETEADRRNFVVHIVDKALEDATLSEQAKVNSLEQFLNSPDLKNAVIATAIDAERNKSDMTQSLLNSPQGLDKFVELIGELIHLRLHRTEMT